MFLFTPFLASLALDEIAESKGAARNLPRDRLLVLVTPTRLCKRVYKYKEVPTATFLLSVGSRRISPFCFVCSVLGLLCSMGRSPQVPSSRQRQWLVVGSQGGWRSRQSVVSSASLGCREMAASWGFRGKL